MERVIKRVTTTVVETICVDEPEAEREASTQASSFDAERSGPDTELSDEDLAVEHDELEVGDGDRRRCPPCSPRR